MPEGRCPPETCEPERDIPCPPSGRGKIDSGAAPSVSVVVPVHNGGAAFRRCFDNLQAADPAPLEIVVVADGDTDGSWRSAEVAGAKVVRLASPGGPARARNEGARKARGDILFFIDADVAIPPNAVALVAGAFGADSQLGACFGSYDDEPLESNLLSQYKNLQHHWVHQTGNEAASTFWAGCGAVRRELFEDLGGFDEGYRSPSIEDIELGYRLRRAGHPIRVLKGLQVKHLKRWTVRSHLRAEFFYRALPWTDLILAEGSFLNDLNLKMASRVSVGLAWLLVLALAVAGMRPNWWPAPATAAAGLLVLNANFYRFLYRKRGGLFLLKSLPWHWFYFLYSGLAFGIGLVRHHLRRSEPAGVLSSRRTKGISPRGD
jgi:glycosyltransferase involved in cell wall biosynthesis